MYSLAIVFLLACTPARDDDRDDDDDGATDDGGGQDEEEEPEAEARPGPYAGCERTRVSDYGDDGMFDWAVFEVFDGDGLRVWWAYDDGADGRIDETYAEIRDARGDVARVESDADGDGTLDVTWEYVRDDDGDAVSVTEDDGADGTADAVGTYVYDEADDLRRVEYDDGVDGDVDAVSHYEWSRDDDAVTVDWWYDEGPDDVPEYTILYVYDAEGELLLERVDDADADGLPDGEYAYGYFPDGQIETFAGTVYDEGAVSYTYSGRWTTDERDRYDVAVWTYAWRGTDYPRTDVYRYACE